MMMMTIYILLNICTNNLFADADAKSMTPSRNTRSYILWSVPSSPGRSFLTSEKSATYMFQTREGREGGRSTAVLTMFKKTTLLVRDGFPYLCRHIDRAVVDLAN